MARPILRALILFVIGITLLLPTLSASHDEVRYTDQVAVLMYHHVHDTDTSSSTITTKLFRNQLTFLRDKGYTFISLDQFRRFMDGSGTVPGNAVLVTFDDGYKSFKEYAYPILKELGIPAVNFIITGTLDNPDSFNIPYLPAADIRAMTSESPERISVQCHTHGMHFNASTPFLTHRLTVDGVKETEEQYRQRVKADTAECVRRLAPLASGTVDSLAYPYGVYDKTSSRLVREAGIRFGFTIVPEMATRRSNPMQIPRINAGSPDISPQALHNSIMRRIVF